MHAVALDDLVVVAEFRVVRAKGDIIRAHNDAENCLECNLIIVLSNLPTPASSGGLVSRLMRLPSRLSVSCTGASHAK